MDLLPDTDQAALAASARDLLERLSGPARLREADPDADPALWSAGAGQGWFALGLPEAGGGLGLGPAEQSLLFRELGRALAAGPFLGTVLAAHVALAAGRDDLAAAFATGRGRAALAVPVRDGAVGPRVRGTFSTFEAFAGVEHVLVVGEEAAALVPAAAVVPARRSCIDPAARAALLDLDADALAVAGSEAVALARILVAALLSGIAEAARDGSVAYAAVREQFGVPIGTFQAVKHRCADAATRAEAAVHLTTLAALSLAAGTPDAARLAASALRVAADAALRNAADDVQNHGGLGFTAEADSHLWVKRAHVLARTLGPLGAETAAVLAG